MCFILSVLKLCNKNSISSIPFFPTSLFAKNVFKVFTLFSFEPDNNVVKLFDDSVWAEYNLSWKDKPKNHLT